MSDGLPGYTCPAIDRVKRALRRLRDGGDVDPVELASCLRELEELRAANTALRDGYTRACRERDAALRALHVRHLTGGPDA